MAKSRVSLKALARGAQRRGPRRGFRTAILTSGKRPALIAELKKRSPSGGVLRERFEHIRLAQELQSAGACALSVLTDERFFGGSLDLLKDVWSFTDVPVLRKDFIIDTYQIYETAASRADAVLIIVRLLSRHELLRFLKLTHELGLQALVEVHAPDELNLALDAGASVIGVNRRDLDSLRMDDETMYAIIKQAPSDALIVAESGIANQREIARLRSLGVQAVLVGEALMRADDPGARVRELFREAW